MVGGSDGAQSLVSTELYDFESNTWTLGPTLNTPRANMSVVTVGSRLYAVGGFSGKKFLTTLEWLDMDNMEWFGHTPRQDCEENTRSTDDLAAADTSAISTNQERVNLNSDTQSEVTAKGQKREEFTQQQEENQYAGSVGTQGIICMTNSGDISTSCQNQVEERAS